MRCLIGARACKHQPAAVMSCHAPCPRCCASLPPPHPPPTHTHTHAHAHTHTRARARALTWACTMQRVPPPHTHTCTAPIPTPAAPQMVPLAAMSRSWHVRPRRRMRRPRPCTRPRASCGGSRPSCELPGWPGAAHPPNCKTRAGSRGSRGCVALWIPGFGAVLCGAWQQACITAAVADNLVGARARRQP